MRKILIYSFSLLLFYIMVFSLTHKADIYFDLDIEDYKHLLNVVLTLSLFFIFRLRLLLRKFLYLLVGLAALAFALDFF